MIRSLMRFATWRLTPDGDPDAAPPTFRQACDVCGESSGTVKDRDLAVSWALRHAGRRPEHRTYTETLTLPYRALLEPGGMR